MVTGNIMGSRNHIPVIPHTVTLLSGGNNKFKRTRLHFFLKILSFLFLHFGFLGKTICPIYGGPF